MLYRMSESAFSAKEKFLDELEEQFLKNVKDFTSDVSSQILLHLPCLRNVVNINCVKSGTAT